MMRICICCCYFRCDIVYDYIDNVCRGDDIVRRVRIAVIVYAANL